MIALLKTSLNSIRLSKVRTFLTVLGVVIGITTVTTLISISKGLQYDMSNLIKGLGTNVLVALGGQIEIDSDEKEGLGQMHQGGFVATDILTMQDVEDIKTVEEVESVSPISLISSVILKNGDKETAPMTIGVFPDILDIMTVIKIGEGKMISSNDEKGVIVIGSGIKEKLFGEEKAQGKKITLNDKEYTVKGIISPAETTNLFASEFDYAAVVPFNTATELNGNEEKVFRIMINVKDDADIKNIKSKITDLIKENHDGKKDFTVLSQDDLLNVFNQFLGMATSMVTAIAAISLIVGGIGIMNIMLVSVTERTSEIGLRKAVGATRWNILSQFLVEAVVITLLGGVIGIIVSYITDFFIAQKTPLTPVITWDIILLACGISIAIGIIFGIWPAMNAAKKDPITALRHE